MAALGNVKNAQQEPEASNLRQVSTIFRLNDYSRISEYLSATYGYKKDQYQIAFSKELSESGGVSLRLFLLMMSFFWTALITDMIGHIDKFPNPLRVRCAIPVLENNFTFDEIQSLSTDIKSPEGKSCFYYDMDYKKIAEASHYNYTHMSDIVQNLIHNATKKKCSITISRYERLVHQHKDVREKYTDFIDKDKHYCESEYWHRYIPIIQACGSLLICLPFGLVGDLYGRKTVYIVTATVRILGSMLVIIDITETIITGRIIFGMIGFLANFSVYLLFTEQCNVCTRLHMAYPVIAVEGISNILLYLLYTIVLTWKYDYLSACLLQIVVPFWMWYLSESPRWLFYMGNQSKAWKILSEETGKKLPDYCDYLESAINRPKVRQHMKLFKKRFFRSRILLNSVLFALAAGIYFTDLKATHELKISALDYHLLAGFGRIAGIVGSYIILIFVGRKKTLFYMYITAALVDISIILQDESHTKTMMFLLMLHNCIINCAIKLMFFHLIEQYPTTHRFTAISICFCFIECAKIYNFFISGYWKPNPRALTNFPLLIFSICVALFVFFTHETIGLDLPDLEREAITKKLDQL